ncbi:MAG TPA: PAS domain S-box protein, partial [Chitinophagales bacterium]|nr:PAS domain S-box protein [Chitinophagales bacterium]
DIETSSRGYAITGKEIYLRPYYKATAKIDGSFRELNTLTHDNTVQMGLLESIIHLSTLKRNIARKIIEARKNGNFEEAKRIIVSGIGESVMSEIRNGTAEFIANEKRLLNVRITNSKISFHSLLNGITLSIFLSVIFVMIALFFFIRDYNKRILSEKKLTESELRTRNFLDALPVGVFIINEAGKPHYANAKSIDILGAGISPELDAMNLEQIYVAYKAGTDIQYPLNEIPILRALIGEKNVQVDDIEILKDNKRIPLRINASPITDSNMHIKYAIAVLEDTTILKRNERALLQANSELETLFRNAPTGIVLLNSQGKIIQWNEQAELIFGWKPEEIMDKYLHEVILPENYRIAHMSMNMNGIPGFFEAKGGKSDNKTIELPAITKYNASIQTEVNVSMTKVNEENFYIVFIEDITEKKKIQEALSSRTDQLIEAQRVANIGSWEWDIVNNKVLRSDELCRIYGIPREEMARDPESKFVHPADKAYVNKVIQKALSDNSPFNFFFRIIRPDGSERVLNTKGKVYKNDEGQVIRVVGTSQDVTDSKKAEQELIKAKQIAEQSLVLKETFLANMSHEIRTPMNAIIGFTDILIKRKLNPQEMEYVQIIKNSGENLLRIINDILDISKIEADMIIFEEHPLSIKDIFKSLTSMLAQKARDKDLQLIYTAEENIPEVLLGDPTRITQILTNLTGNSIKFTKNGKVEIIAKVVAEENDKSIIQFEVTDTGIGISEDKLNTIFERFKQAEAHTTRNYGGTGLGLSIAKQLVELQGGQMSITSKPGKGTHIIFTLPLKKTKEAYKIKPDENE